MKKLSIVVLMMAASISMAQNIPLAFASDNRVKHVLFKEHDVIPLKGKTFTTTDIQFGESERIISIEGGDTSAWMATYHPELPNRVFLKPTILNSKTNLTVITNLHTYYFALSSNKTLREGAENQTYGLIFDYPKTQVATLPKKPEKPKSINRAYRFSGSPQLVPLHVFDDGQFTYFELSDKGAIPAIFAVDDKSGKEATVNTRREGKYLVIQRTAPQFTLRLGGLVTSVFNIPEINRINHNQRPA